MTITGSKLLREIMTTNRAAVKEESKLERVLEIMNHGKTIPTCKQCLDPGKTAASRFGLYHTGVNYNLAQIEKTYNCPSCQDRGIIEVGLDSFNSPIYANCTCKEIKRAANKLKSSGLRERQLKYKIEDYRVNDNNRKMFDGVKRYLSAWPDLIKSDSTSKGFFLVGNAGIGKTMLSCIIAKDMLDKGVSVVFTSSANILSELRQAQFLKDDEGIESKIEVLATAQSLIIDDCLKEKPSEWIQSMYYRLIDLRYRNNLLTGFSANYYPRDMEDRLGNFGEATVSRILGMTKEYFLSAKDYDHRVERSS